MNTDAERHVEKAAEFIAKGDDFYRQAGEEIRAAREAGAKWKEIADRLDRSSDWCQQVAKMPANRTEPAWRRGSHGTKEEVDKGIVKFLADAPMEIIERMVDDLPPERKLIVAAAAGSDYAKARVAENERVKNLTPAERKEIEAAKSSITDSVTKAAGGFAALGVVGHLEQATEDLAEMTSEGALTVEIIYRITEAHNRFVTELEVARAMVGLEGSTV